MNVDSGHAPPLDERQRAQIATWSGGDYRSSAARLQPAAEVLLDHIPGLQGARLLDVAAGTGNVAVAASRHGATVVATDLAPRMVELGRARTAEHAPAVEWRQADACDLPFGDGEFDVVTSAFGLMFADPKPAVHEAARVLRVGGHLGLAVWHHGGLHQAVSTALEPWIGAPPPSAAHPLDWGRPEVARARLRTHFDDITIVDQHLPWHFESLSALRRFFDQSPPHVMISAGLRAEEAAALSDAIVDVYRPFLDNTGRVRTTVRYLVIIARRNGDASR